MPEDVPLNQDAFRFLAAQAGLDRAGTHLDELYPYVQVVLCGVRWLDQIDVAESEPDLAFNPLPEAN